MQSQSNEILHICNVNIYFRYCDKDNFREILSRFKNQFLESSCGSQQTICVNNQMPLFEIMIHNKMS